MSYIEENLLNGEKVLHKGRVHWWAWGKGLAIVLTGFLVGAQGEPMPFWGGMIGLFGLVLLVRGLVTVWTTELAVTDKRVIAKFGLISRETIELVHQKVEGLSVSQSILGRLLGFGTITVNGTGSGKTPVPHITQPLVFRRKALEVIQN
jgi:uncharacterized membrane protein YdbT with pleckstrin-like domain